MRKRQVDYITRHPERVKESQRKWRESNKEKLAASKAEWRKKNLARVKENNKSWREANKKQIAEKAKLRRDVNREQRNRWHKAWRDKNKDKILSWRANQKAVKRAALKLDLTPEQRAKIAGFYAQARAMSRLMGEPYHVDHIKPLAKGGLHHPDNLQVLRGIDNLKKGAKYDRHDATNHPADDAAVV